MSEEQEKFYLLQMVGDGKDDVNIPPFFLFSDDICFNKHRKVEAYWRCLYGSFVNSIFQFYVSHNYDEQTAKEESERLIVEWSKDKEEVAKFQEKWLSFCQGLGDLLGINFALVKPESLYWFIIHDPALGKAGLIWLMTIASADEEVSSQEIEVEEPLTSGDYLIDLETKLRLAYAEGGFDPSLLDRLCVGSLQRMLRLLSEHQNRIAKKYDLDGKGGKKDNNLIALNSLISTGEESVTEPVQCATIDDQTSDRLAALGVVLPEH